jgi:hypothetical protein
VRFTFTVKLLPEYHADATRDVLAEDASRARGSVVLPADTQV